MVSLYATTVRRRRKTTFVNETAHSRLSPLCDPWLAPFRSRIEARLRPDMRILDVGAGRQPVLRLDERPQGCHYTGLDSSERELSRAPEGSYSESVVADITDYQPGLEESFEMIVSWQVLEHVKPLEVAFGNMHAYLQPGGQIVAFLSGAFSVFALANRLLPDRVGRRVVADIMNRDPDTVFPARYDQCSLHGLQRILVPWNDWEIAPAWGGARYLSSLPAAQRAYRRYESWAERQGHDALATHYLIVATK